MTHRTRLSALAALLALLCLWCPARTEENGAAETPEPYAFEVPASYEDSLLRRMGYAYADCYVLCAAGQRLYIIPLTRERDLTLDQGEGVINTFHVTRDSVRMAFSTCDNQDCVDEGTVTEANRTERILGNMIICLPHGVTLELYTYEEMEALLQASADRR